jgi:hypothetical protein
MGRRLIARYWLVRTGISVTLLTSGCYATTPVQPPAAAVSEATPSSQADAYGRATPLPTPALPIQSTPSPAPVRTREIPTSTVVLVPFRVVPTPLPTRTPPPQPAPNFAFTFGYGSCAPIKRVLNTFNDTLTQQPPGEEPVTIPFSLSEGDELTIYQKMAAINFFSYPPRFTIPIPENQQMIGADPYPEYSFTARNGDLFVSVQWADSISRPTTTEADNLRELIALLSQTIETHPDFARLPPLSEACA